MKTELSRKIFDFLQPVSSHNARSSSQTRLLSLKTDGPGTGLNNTCKTSEIKIER